MATAKEIAAAVVVAATVSTTSVAAQPSKVEPTPQSEAASGVMESLEAVTDDKKKTDEAERQVNG